jgi:hypothetical protein
MIRNSDMKVEGSYGKNKKRKEKEKKVGRKRNVTLYGKICIICKVPIRTRPKYVIQI